MKFMDEKKVDISSASLQGNPLERFSYIFVYNYKYFRMRICDFKPILNCEE